MDRGRLLSRCRRVSESARFSPILSAQCEGNERVVGAGPGGDHDIMAAGARAVGHRHRSVLKWNLAAPKFLTGLLIESVQISIAAPDEYQPAACDHGAAAAIG